MRQNELLAPVLFLIGAVLLAYTAVTIVDQRRSLVFRVKRGAWSYVLEVALLVCAVANYQLNGQGMVQLGTGFVCVAFACFMAAVRNGVGSSGIYIDGVRHAWGKVSALRLKKDHGVPVLYYTIKDFERVIKLEGSRYKDVERFVAEVRKDYDL